MNTGGSKFFFKSAVVVVVAHVLIVLLIVNIARMKGCRMKKQPVEIVEFMIAVDPIQEEVPEAKPEPDPPTPPAEPDKTDVPAEVKPKPTPPKPKPKPKPSEPKPKPKPSIKQNNRVEGKSKIKTNVQSKERQTLSDEEIQKWLGKRARIGEKTSLPSNELSLNFSVIMNAMKKSWVLPPRSADGYQPAQVEISIGPGGAISNPRIARSSGSKMFDDSALDAVKNTPRVYGLSQEFIATYPTVTIEFKRDE